MSLIVEYHSDVKNLVIEGISDVVREPLSPLRNTLTEARNPKTPVAEGGSDCALEETIVF
jgi:hypothetical protein